MNTNTKNPLCISAAVALLAALTGGAHADDAPQIHVKYGDLNVNDAAGAAVLYRRIRFAATQVCERPGMLDLAKLQLVEACVARAVAAAVAAVDKPALTAVYQVKMGGTAIRLAGVH